MNPNSNDKDKDKDEEFEKMIRDIEEMMKESIRDISKSKIRPGKSYVHGFNINISPEGKAEVNEFGNYPRKKCNRNKLPKQKEAPNDIIERQKEINMTFFMPETKKEDIDIKVVDKNLELDIFTPKKILHKKIPLPCQVKPNNTKASYKNGVLDITLQKRNKKRNDTGFNVNIK